MEARILSLSGGPVPRAPDGRAALLTHNTLELCLAHTSAWAIGPQQSGVNPLLWLRIYRSPRIAHFRHYWESEFSEVRVGLR